jgi:hypothetical protein
MRCHPATCPTAAAPVLACQRREHFASFPIRLDICALRFLIGGEISPSPSLHTSPIIVIRPFEYLGAGFP